MSLLLLLSLSGLGCATTSPATATTAPPPAAEGAAMAGVCNPESDPNWAHASALEKHEIYERCHPQQ
jgi:hypothetical protein